MVEFYNGKIFCLYSVSLKSSVLLANFSLISFFLRSVVGVVRQVAISASLALSVFRLWTILLVLDAETRASLAECVLRVRGFFPLIALLFVQNIRNIPSLHVLFTFTNTTSAVKSGIF